MFKSNVIEQNEYAKDKFGKHVYILDVVSGQKGYWCIGCGHEMQAVHGNIEHRKKYFRHVAKDVTIERQCTFSNEEYRHKLAIEILQFTKRIKVPNLYSYSQDGKTKVLIEDSKFIEADHVRAELTFYEDDEGEVRWGKNPEIEERNLLIRPDLTFFNVKGEPQLLLEIVVSHKIGDEKKVKLKRLGIDTIQIKIPKDSEENIKKSLETSNYTQWVYNNEQERTNFIQLSKRDRTQVLSTDEHEAKLFGESFECRKSEIGNLIRSIEKCLGGQRYRDNVFQLEQELSRVKRNTTVHRERHEELRNAIRERVRARHKDTLETIERQEEEYEAILGAENNKLQQQFDAAKRIQNENFGKLEERYRKKSRELESNERKLRAETIGMASTIESSEDIGKQFGTIQDATSNLQREIEGIARRRTSIRNNFESNRRRIESEFQQLERDEQSRYTANHRNIRTRIDSLPEEFRRKNESIEEYYRKEERRVRNHFELKEKSMGGEYNNFGERIIQYMEGENTFRSELPNRIKNLFEAKRILSNWEKEYSTYQRYRLALECIRKGDYKKWN